MVSAVLEGIYRIETVKAFKYKSKFQFLRIEFAPCLAFLNFLAKYSTNDDKMCGLVRCFFVGSAWIVEIDTSIIQVTLETSEE